MSKITIKNRYTNEVIFEFEGDTIKSAVTEAVKKGISLREANLRGADLCEANLYGANLRGANLSVANLCGANLYNSKNLPFIPLACPSEGSFIGWKKWK